MNGMNGNVRYPTMGQPVAMSAGPNSEDFNKSHPSYTRPLVAAYDTTSRVGALQCKEFWPSALNTEVKAKHALFECFSAVVDRANLWLREHSNFQVLNCETSEKKVTQVVDVNNDSLHYSFSPNVSSFIKGLRLWLIPGYQCFSETRALQFVDVAPQCISSEVDIGGLQFETISEALDRFNDQIKRNPLPGHILTVETVSVIISRDTWDGNINTEECRWVDLFKRHRFSFLRVFYITGTPQYENIGLADFVPEQINGTSNFTLRPRFAGFDSVMEQAATWISRTEGVRITNVQTIETKYWSRKELESGQKVNTLEAFETKIERRARLFVLRVVYVRCVDEAASQASPCEPPPQLSSKTFRPAILGNETCCGVIDIGLEGIHETTQRISEWLDEGGATPFCAQTLTIPQWFIEKDDMASRTVHNGEWYLHKGNGYKHSLMHLVRVYIQGSFRTAGPEYFGPAYNRTFCCPVQ